MIIAMEQLKRWLSSYGISTDNLTVIINFSDADAAIRFVHALTDVFGSHPAFNEGIEIAGIKVELQSPVHKPLP